MDTHRIDFGVSTSIQVHLKIFCKYFQNNVPMLLTEDNLEVIFTNVKEDTAL